MISSKNRNTDPEHPVLTLERCALERWCRGDPSGFLEICAQDVVYFDPFLERRLDGLPALTLYYEGLRGRVRAERFELLNPLVQLIADAAVLTFNFVSFANEQAFRWNCTEVYRRAEGVWQIVQTHWSLSGPPE